ncbi:short-chain dehydrogenase/reductase family 42E member 1-like isoform X2 [Pocillopora verrucosa]|uniref:short-chain dehydrogenase/reductase family 42E member 1-like isoform X2 n=1 Tax=Pocillopora verrucosa TaxID=203993 RepID=UPI003342CB10
MVQGRKILVTGGGGYFGHKLGNELKKLGAVVVLFDISWPLDDVVYEQMECFQGDITSKEDVRKIFISHQIDVVFHSASYGMSGREQHPDHYSRTKSIAEQTVLNANGLLLKDGKILKTCALRPAGIYGEGELRHLPRIVSYIERGLFAFTYGQDDSIVDFVHVNNLVQAHILAGKTLMEADSIAAGEAYFISDDSPVNNFEFFRPLVEGLGYKFPKLKLPITLVYMVAFLTELVHSVIGRYIYNFQPLLTRTEVYKTAVTHYFSMKKARSHFGYSPQKYSLEGVIEHFKKNGHGRHRRPSSLLYHIVNIVVGIMFACLLLAWLPRVDTYIINSNYLTTF